MRGAALTRVHCNARPVLAIIAGPLVDMACVATGEAETMPSALARVYGGNPDLNQQRASVRATDENLSRATSSTAYGGSHKTFSASKAGDVTLALAQDGVTVIVSLLMTYGDARISPNDYIRTKPRIWARETACARLSTASFMKMFLTCDFTVSGAILSSRAISLLDRP
jgi:hypothetical protein